MVDRFNLLIIHLDALRGDDVPEQLVGGMVELTLPQLEIKVALPPFLKDLLYVVAMFGQVPEADEDVVYVL